MKHVLPLAEKLYPFAYSVTGAGNDAAVQVYQDELDFRVHEYASGQTLNGWFIPPAMTVEKAEIRKDGVVLYDAAASPLGVPAQSDSFQGTLSLDALKQHVFSDNNDAAAIPYHWTRLYRPDEALWGLCAPKRVVDEWGPGEYEVDLRVRKDDATMKVLVHELPGASHDAILINGHNCHPYQANDDISGVAVGIRLLQRLAQLPKRRFSYILMVAPELFGPVYWLDEIGAEQASRIKGAVMLKSVGNDRDMRLQQSFTGDSRMDMAAHNVMRERYGEYDWGAFRAVYGNDETVFEAPPFNIPSISLTRWPFDQYHTDQDTPDHLSEKRLVDTVDAAFDICLALEADVRLKPKFEGLVSLSRHGLYKPVPPVGPGGVDYTSKEGRWNRLMNDLPRHMDAETGLIDIAERYELPVLEVYEYAMAWVKAGLAEVSESRRAS